MAQSPRQISPAQRLLHCAQQCRVRDLEQLSLLGELVGNISALVHTLQQERGTSSIFLASRGSSFAAQRLSRMAVSCELEISVRDRLTRFDEQVGGVSAGARFYVHAAQAFQALDALPDLRERIAALTATSRQTVEAFSTVIACLQAASFETADLAADPATSRAVVALASFAHGKEYAGQERAIAGAAFSRGRFVADESRRLRYLSAAQEQAFKIFAQFAAPAHVALFRDLAGCDAAVELQRMRSAALTAASAPPGGIDASADHWYAVSTLRIDAMKQIEDAMAAELGRLCAQHLAEARNQLESRQWETARGARGARGARARRRALGRAVPVAMLIIEADLAAEGPGLDAGIGFYALERTVPRPMRSLLDVFAAQSRRLDDMSSQLECARAALAGRKLIERAKGLLMQGRRLSESDAYRLMRQTAMRQNKRVVDVAAAIVGMAQTGMAPGRP